jgi:hypothetical protein
MWPDSRYLCLPLNHYQRCSIYRFMNQYHLDKSSKKHICPSCQKKSMVVYVYADNQQPVDALLFGRCDRENNCGYHYHPNKEASFEPREVKEVKPPKVEQIYPDESITKPLIGRTKKAVSPLHVYAKSKTISADHMIKWGVYSDGDNGEKTAFVFQNRAGNICNIKYFKYKADGHRDKDFNSYSLKQPKPVTIEGQQYIKKYFMCLFGEHLLDPDKKKIVCVVESEKSAVLAAHYYPQFDWLACGSASGLSDGSNETADKISPLRNRTIYWLCDADKAGRANSSIKNLKKHGLTYEIIDLFPDRTDGYDIGDALADGIVPDIETEKSDDELAAENRKRAATFEQEWHLLYEWPDGVNKHKVKDDVQKYGVFIHDKKVYIQRNKKSRKKEDAEFEPLYFFSDITNFSIESLGHIGSSVDPRRLVTITNIHGHTEDIELPTKAFTSDTTFCEMIEGMGNFTFDGNKLDLKKLRRKLYDEMKTFDEVESLGWHPRGYMLWANGVTKGGKFYPINKYGFAEIGQSRFYLPALSCINDTDQMRVVYENERKFTYVKRDDVSFKTWAKLFTKVHKDNGKISLAWFMASLFRDHIYRLFRFFPHLFLFGPPATGKSQIAWSIRYLGFNSAKVPFNLSGGTKVAFHREFSHFTNFPCWFDEYDNNIDWDRVQALKAAYDGAGHNKSIKDSENRTKSVPVNSSCVISGQQMPIADIALFKRVMLCQFYQTEFGQTEQEDLKALEAMQGGGLSFITAGIMQYRKHIEENFMARFEMQKAKLEKMNKEGDFGIEDRTLTNYVICLTVYSLIEEKKKNDFPFTSAELELVMMKFMKEQMSHIKSANETNTFWDMVEYLLDAGLIENEKDFMIREESTITVKVDRKREEKNLGQTKNVLYLRFSKIIPLYKENFKRQNSGTATPMDKNSLKHYLQHSKEFLGACDNIKFDNSTTSAYAFDYDLLHMKGIVNLNRGADEHQPVAAGGDDERPF